MFFRCIMARTAKRLWVEKVKTKRHFNEWQTGRMKRAIEEFRSKGEEANLRQIARAWGVPKSTLQRRLKGKVVGTDHCSGRKPILSQAAEAELADTIKMLAARGFPLGMKEIRQLAFQYSTKIKLNVFKWKHGEAGYYWFLGFMKRHSELKVRKPEALSAARAMSMTKPLVDNIYCLEALQ